MRKEEVRTFESFTEIEHWLYGEATSKEISEFYKYNKKKGIKGEMPLRERLRRMQKAGIIKIKDDSAGRSHG